MGSVARYVETVVVSPYAVLTRISRVASSSPSAPPQRHAVFVGTRQFYIGTITALPRAGKLLQSDGGMRAYFNQHDEIVVVDAEYCYQVTFDSSSDEPDVPPYVLWVGGAGIFAAKALPSGARSDGEGEGGADESGAIARGYTSSSSPKKPAPAQPPRTSKHRVHLSDFDMIDPDDTPHEYV